MKDFIKTTFGRVLLFIVCIFSVLSFCMSVFLAFEFYYSNYYVKSERAVVEAAVEDTVRLAGRDIIMSAVGVKDDTGNAVYFPDDETNLVYRIVDDKGKVIGESKDRADAWDFNLRYGILSNSEGRITDVFYSYEESPAYSDEMDPVIYYTFNASLKEGLPADDRIAFYAGLAHICYSLRYWIYVIGAGAFVLMILSFIALMCSAGHKPGTEEIFPGPLYKIPYDVLAVCGMILIMFGILIGDSLYGHSELLGIVIIAATASFCMAIVLGLCLSLATRVKRKDLLKATLTWKLIKLCIRFMKWCWARIVRLSKFNCYLFSKIPVVWKTLLVFSAICMAELLIMLALIVNSYNAETFIFIWFLERLMIAAFLMYIAIMLRKLQAGAAALAAGDLTHHLNTDKMFWDFRRSGEDLNNIAVGMSYAVEDRLKSERMKTELITNVSHDLKTPLTSIVNYASLIEAELKGIPDHGKTEDMSLSTQVSTGPDREIFEGTGRSMDAEVYDKISSYSSVLVRQSEKLKRLIEDLVEASKASTGNLDVQLSPCDPAIFISQAAGEYEERLEQAELTLITKQPEKEVFIMADGRRMWRIFDNLMSNICKYSLPGSRVYVSLEVENAESMTAGPKTNHGKNETADKKYAVISFKNTSRDPLDIAEEELMERFVRGDSSRTEEGNGLGLSIAKSLAELQGGRMDIHIDGDLFKSTLKFPILS